MNTQLLDKLLETFPERGIPGCDLSVTLGGKEVYRKQVGFSDAEKTRPVSENDMYWVFSISKTITCAAALKLVEEGKLGLDDPVYKYLPEYKDLLVKVKGGDPVPAQNVMTVRQLFAMTSGLNYNLSSPSLLEAREDPNASTRELVAAIVRTPLDYEPGTRFNYSLAHDVLGAIIEVVTGMRFFEYLDKLLFTPLGMNDTTFHPTEEQLNRLSEMYVYDRGTERSVLRENKNEYKLSDKYESGGAGICTTVNDYMKFVTCLANGGKAPDGTVIFKPETIAMMQVDQLDAMTKKKFFEGRLFGYGWGLCGRVHTDPVVSMSKSPVGEFGWDGAAGALSLIDPKNQIALFFAMEVRSCTYMYNRLHAQIINTVYEALGF